MLLQEPNQKPKINTINIYIFLSRLIYLGCLGVFGGIIIPTHAQHVFCTVIELREAIKLAVVVGYCWLIDTAEGGLGVVGAVEERLKNESALVKVSRSSQVEPLLGRSNLILQVRGETGVWERRLGCLANMLT